MRATFLGETAVLQSDVGLGIWLTGPASCLPETAGTAPAPKCPGAVRSAGLRCSGKETAKEKRYMKLVGLPGRMPNIDLI